MAVVPGATPVTGTLTLVAPAEKVTVEGTMATAVLAELRLTVKPLAGAGPDRLSVTFVVADAKTVCLRLKLSDPVTWTCWLVAV